MTLSALEYRVSICSYENMRLRMRQGAWLCACGNIATTSNTLGGQRNACGARKCCMYIPSSSYLVVRAAI